MDNLFPYKGTRTRGSLGSSLILFILVTVLLIGISVVLESLFDDYIGAFYYFYDTYSDNDTLTSTGMNHTFSLDRISDQYNGWLYVAYDGGNVSDQAFVNGYLIGNFTPPGPDNLSIQSTYLDVNTTVRYVYAVNGTTNVTAANLTWYTYDYCDYGEQSCLSMKVIRDSSGDVLQFLSWLPLLLAASCIFIGLAWLMGASR